MAMFGNQGFKDWNNVGVDAYMPKAQDISASPPAASAPPQKMPMWKAALGGLFDSILSQTGGQPVFIPQMMQNRQREYEEAQYQRHQSEELQRQIALKQFDLDHPKPVNNDTVADYQFIMQNLGPEAGRQYLQNKANPPQYRQGPDGQFYRIDMQPGPMPGAQPRVLGSSLPQGWTVQGGPSQPATGGFPDPMNAPGHMTSGRRTVEGNRAVGGVPNSHHLTGDAADYTGASMDQLRGYFGPNARYLDEGNHVHVTLPGYGRVPYFGRNGTQGAR